MRSASWHWFLLPNPPPMYSQTTRTRSGGRSRSRATSARQLAMPWVGVHSVSSSPSQRATAQRGSICALLWCLET